MKERYRRQPPAEDQHRGSDLCSAAVDDEKDDQQETAERSDD